MATTTTAAPEAPKPIGAMGRIIGVLISPRETFEDIARRPSWLAPIVVLAIISIATTAAIGQRIGWRNVIEKQIAQNPSAQQRMEKLTPDQREHMIELQSKIAPYAGYIFGAIGFPIVALIVAAILLGIFNATSSAELDFKSSFSIVSHAYMPFVIASLLAILIMFLKSPDQIDLQNVLASNLGAFVSSGSARWLKVLGASLDIFSFWTLGLMAFGYSVARPKKISFGSALTWVVVIWAVYVLIKVGLAAL
jgi:hypothetical protein